MTTNNQTTNPGHTPGPWRVEGAELIGNSTALATLHWHSGRDAENAADAALIAAAPRLLAALKDILKAYEQLDWQTSDDDNTPDPRIYRARAAILAAGGSI